MFSSIICSPKVPAPDIVIATSPQFFAGIAGYVISRLRRRPFVFEIRDLWPEQIAVVGFLNEKNLVYRFFQKLAGYLYYHCDALVTVGEGYRDQIIEGYGVRANHISIIPNGISPDLFYRHDVRDKIRENLGWQDKFIVLYLGTLGMSQKLETVLVLWVLEAADRLKANPAIHFVFVGEGAEKQKLIKFKLEKKLANCEFLPMQSKAKVPDFYETADVCVVPLRNCQLFQGNYPSKMFESMAMECPIILSAGGKSAELLTKADAGLTVAAENPDKLAQAVQSFYADPDLRTRKGKNGRNFVINNFTRKYWAKQYISLLEEQVRH